MHVAFLKLNRLVFLVYYNNLLENKAFISVKEDCSSRECALLLIFSAVPDIMTMRTEKKKHSTREYDEFATKFFTRNHIQKQRSSSHSLRHFNK
jgi:hypothetical protein